MLSRKMKDMKKGGYTLFSDKTRKMLLAVGLSMLSVGVLATSVNAAPTITGEFKKTDEENYVTYQLRLKEEGEGLHINKLYYWDGTASDYLEVPADNKLAWQANEANTEVLAVVKVADNVTKFKVDNDKVNVEITDEGLESEERVETPAPESSEDLVVVSENPDEVAEITVDNDAPDIKWKYKNVEGNYVQFCAEDATKIYRVVDEDNKDRVKIEEKDQDTELTAKYVLKQEDKIFYVYDILGNKAEVNIDEIGVTYTIAAKNTDGQKVVLNMALPDGATLTSIETVEGVNIANDTRAEVAEENRVIKAEKGYDGDSLVAVYSQVPEGTTYVNVNYTIGAESVTIPVALDLDLTAPVLVKRNVDGDGSIVQTEGTARAYKNADATEAIVEVEDLGSGIVKIVACTGAGTDSDPIVESTATNQVFDIDELPTSVLQLMELPEGATFIRVVDAIGNQYDIPLETAVAADTDGITLVLSGDGTGAIATFRDTQAGLDKLVRAKKEVAADKVVTPEEGDKSYAPDARYKTVKSRADIERFYPVTEKEIELNVADLQGVPEMTAVDVFGNTAEDSLNRILFHEDYVLVDVGAGDANTTQNIAVKVSDARRIKKITATIDGVEKVLEVFEIGTNATGAGPVDLDKVYEIGNGAEVTAVTVYHYNGEVTQNIIDITNETEKEHKVNPDDIEDTAKYVVIEQDADEINVAILYGIRKIENSDGCEIEFYDDLPKEVNVYTKDGDGNNLASVIVTDGLGYTYDLMKEDTLTKYAAGRGASEETP